MGIILILGLVIPEIEALTCNPTSITKTWNVGETVSSIPITCTNPPNTSAVSINKIGSYFTLTPTPPISSGTNTAGTTTNFQIDFSSAAPAGTFEGAIIFSDSTPIIPITLTVNSGTQQAQTGIIVFPTSKVINVQQGQKKSQNIQLIVPLNYPSSITVQSVSFNPDIDVVKFGDLDLGSLSAGTTLTIPLILDATNAQTGTYSTKINILATNSTGQVQLTPTHLDINIQAGVTPITNTTFSSPPSCSLSSIIMAVNNTYTFTCTNAISNIDISPEINPFFIGLGAEVSSGIYTYKFKPIAQGNTNFKANFRVLNSPVFTPYSQEVKISSTGSAVAGTTLELFFLPALNLAKPKEAVGIQVIDNKTGDLIPSAQLYIDTIFQNSSQGTFYFAFEREKNYFIRALASGYNDLTRTFKLTSTQMNITVSPKSGDTLTQFSITTDAPNATLLIDGSKVTNPYLGTLLEGVHEIRGSKDGYIDGVLNVTVFNALIATATEGFNKGSKQQISLSRIANWTLVYLEDPSSPENILANQTGQALEFTPSKYGIYRLLTDGREVWRGETQNKAWRIFRIHWGWYATVIILCTVTFFYYRSKKKSLGLSHYTGNPN